jgi:hypothetical protein
VTFLVAGTAVVVITNPALVAPAGTVMEAGTEAAGSLLERATTVPPEGAGPFSWTVFMPVIWLPPATVVGYSVSEDNAIGSTVKVAVLAVL